MVGIEKLNNTVHSVYSFENNTHNNLK